MLHSRSFLSKGVVVGTFKLDCKTVYDKAGNDYMKKMEFSLFLFTLQWIIFFHTMYAMMLGKYFFLSIHNSSCYYIFGMLWMNLGFFSKWCWSSFLEVKKYFHILLSRSELDRKYFWHVVRVVGRLFFLIFHSFGFATTGTSKALPTVWQSTWYFQIGCSHSYGTARYINFIFAWKLAYTWVYVVTGGMS